jgi:hypothetical protein
MDFELLPHQEDALLRLKNGSVLIGGVGSGKSITALEYFRRIAPQRPLIVVSTAKKRDSGEWYRDAMKMSLKADLEVVSWNAIPKCVAERDTNFIFDEQRVVGYGVWTKSFIEITKHNRWLLLTATPADSWMDLIPVFIAHGFYRNKSDFCEQHVRWSRFTKYPKVEGYYDEYVLRAHRDAIFVEMPHLKHTVRHEEFNNVAFDSKLQRVIFTERWNPYDDAPIKDAGEMIRLLRRAANTDPSRLEKILDLHKTHPRMIIFYNHNYELDALRGLMFEADIPFAEWNGHKHEPLPDEDTWMYLVQYQAGSEGWNCTTTDTVVFFSLPYSYRNFEQAKGRIDRLDTPFTNLHYYIFRSRAMIDQAIWKNLQKKKNFQATAFKKLWDKPTKKTSPLVEKHQLKEMK